jgi:hypothetical protein
MENSEKGLRAEVTTNYLRLTDAAIRAATLPPGKTGGQMSGFTKMVNRLVKEAGVAKFTMHDLRRSLRTIMSRCGYDNEIQRLCVGQKPCGIDQVYNHDEQWIIRKMAFEAAHDYIAQLVGAKRVGKVVRLQRTNPLDTIKAGGSDRAATAPVLRACAE